MTPTPPDDVGRTPASGGPNSVVLDRLGISREDLDAVCRSNQVERLDVLPPATLRPLGDEDELALIVTFTREPARTPTKIRCAALEGRLSVLARRDVSVTEIDVVDLYTRPETRELLLAERVPVFDANPAPEKPRRSPRRRFKVDVWTGEDGRLVVQIVYDKRASRAVHEAASLRREEPAARWRELAAADLDEDERLIERFRQAALEIRNRSA